MDFAKYNPLKAIIALFSIIALLPSALSVSDAVIAENIALQEEHMEYLKNEYYKDYTPVDESQFAGFDISKAVADGVKYNEVAFVGTHNSYQLASTEEYAKIYDALNTATFGIVDDSKTDFNMEFLTRQLEAGIRSLEIDIETVVKNGETSFVVSHVPLIDETSSCYDFEKAIEEIKMWSDMNPGHLPVTIIIEPKKNVIPVKNMKNFSIGYAVELDALLREVLGDTLLTPAEMMGEYESFREMRENDGWLPLGDTMGKVLVLLHDTTVTSKYIALDESIKTQAMFPMLRYSDRDKSYASFIIDNDPADVLKHKAEAIDRCRLIVRTRADSYPSYSDKRSENAGLCGAQIVSTDYPVRTDTAGEHTFTFNGGYLIKLTQEAVSY